MKRVLTAVFLLAALTGLAQKGPESELGFHPGKLYDFTEMDSVNLFNGNLTISIPIGPRYQVSQALSYQLNLVYNGKVWDVETSDLQDCPIEMGPGAVVCEETMPNRRSNAGVGWRVSLGRLLAPSDPTAERPGSSEVRYAFIYEGPAGDEHAFTGHAGPEVTTPPSERAAVTQDGSNLRLVYLQPVGGQERLEVEFPSGERHEFTGYDSNRSYRLTRIRDRFDNDVNLTYTSDTTDPTGRRISKLTIADDYRTHEIDYQFLSADYYDKALAESVDHGALIWRIRLAGHGGRAAVYEFSYEGETTVHLKESTPALLPVLRTLTQPDGSTFEFTYYKDGGTPGESNYGRQGSLATFKLPTGAVTTYHYGFWWSPLKFTCASFSGLGINDAGVVSRTISEGGLDRTWVYSNTAGPIAHVNYPNPSGNYCCVAFNQVSFPNDGPRNWVRTSVLSPTEADGRRNRADHYFDAYSLSFPYTSENQGGQGCDVLPEPHLLPTPLDPWAPQEFPGTGGAYRDAFGYPGTRGGPSVTTLPAAPHTHSGPDSDSRDADGRRLTTITYSNCSDAGDCTNGKLERATYTKYERHPLATNDLQPSFQLQSSKTVFLDDSGCGGTCFVASNSTDDNGAGYYRQTTATSNYPNAKQTVSRTEYQTWDLARATVRAEVWLPTLSTQSSVEESGPDGVERRRTLTTFDATTGALLRRRMLVNPAQVNNQPQVSSSDLLEVYERTGGNVTSIKTYGGDKQATLGSDDHLAQTALGAAWYRVDQTYHSAGRPTGGVLATSQVYDRDGNPFGPLSVNRDIDPTTGAVNEDRTPDPGVTTVYTYDPTPLRLKKVDPPGELSRSYAYHHADQQTGRNAHVVETVDKLGTVIATNTFEFDGLGRVRRTSVTQPDGKVATVQTDYDGKGRKRCETQPFAQLTHVFNDFGCETLPHTRYSYDSQDRPLTVTAPDRTVTTHRYVGARIVERDQSVLTMSGVATATIVEQYDAQGRLTSVTEGSGTNDAPVTTFYRHNIDGKLTRVTTRATVSGEEILQERTFTYDNRGFLTQETQPELERPEAPATSSNIAYGQYDAKGHAWQQTTGPTTLQYVFDPAERLTSVTGPTGLIKSFLYRTTSPGKGQLGSATRRNVLASAGTVDVTETYTYSPINGLVDARSTKVDKITQVGGSETASTVQTFQYSMSHDEFQQPSTISMPTCTMVGCTMTDAITNVRNRRTVGKLTEVDGYAKLSYHPSGMVAGVEHQTPNLPKDSYDARDGLARPSRITFGGCSSTTPYFLPGNVFVNPEPASCGLRITWPAAAICGASGGIRYTVLRNGVPLPGASCLTSTSYTDNTAVKQASYVYSIQAEGPATAGGLGLCNGGQTTVLQAAPKQLFTCDTDISLTTNPLLSGSVGSTLNISALLKGSSSALSGQTLEFTVFGIKQTAVTGADGRASVNVLLDVPPGNYTVKIRFPGSAVPSYLPTEVTAQLTVSCDSFSYAVRPLALNTLREGGTYTVDITASRHCSWTPVPDPLSFVTVAPATGTSGSGTFTITVPSATIEETPRTTYVTVANRTVKVEQGNGCVYDASPGVAYLSDNPGSAIGEFDIAAPQGCAWTLTVDMGWITLLQDDQVTPAYSVSGSGPKTIFYKSGRNTSGKKRTAVLSIGGRTVARINQNGPSATVCPGPSATIEIVGPSHRTVQTFKNLSDTKLGGQYLSLRALVPVGNNLKYVWYVGGSPKPVCDSGPECASLTILPGTPDYPSTNGRNYSVQISNDCGSVASAPVSIKQSVLTVNTNATLPYFGDPSLDRGGSMPNDRLSAGPGAVVSLSANSVQPTNSSLTYQWYQGLQGDTSTPIGSGKSVSVTPEFTTPYWVLITDDRVGKQLSRSVLVTVTRPPKMRAVRHDFSGDGEADLIFHNTGTLANELWSMNDTTYVSSRALTYSNGATNNVHSIGDINADGKPDLLWRDSSSGANQVWLMDTYRLKDSQTIETRAGANWVIGASADMDGDSYDDLIWHNNGTGENEIWFMAGNTRSGTWALPASANTWGLHGAGDFNSDGKVDLFFHDRTTGDNSIWLMSDAVRSGVTNDAETVKLGSRKLRVTTQALPRQADLNVLPAVVADFNNDDKPDVIWRNKVTGANTAWIMNGTTVSETRQLQAKVGTNWQIAGGGSTVTDGISEPVTGTATAITGTATSAPSGGTTTISATLRAGTTPLVNKPLIVTLNGTEMTRLATDSTGSITAVVNIGSLAAGTYANAIRIRYAGETGYLASLLDVSLTVTPSAAVVTWSTPAAITYPAALTASQLNATANVPGTFAYSPALGTVPNAGAQQLTVLFTPTDPGRAQVTATVVLQVQKATPSITWTAPAGIRYGTALTTLQLSASSSTPGTLTYTPAAGSILNVGQQTLNVTLTPTNSNYNSVSTSTTLTVAKGDQILRWSPATVTFGSPLGAAQLNATVLTSGPAPAGALTYTPASGTVLAEGTHALSVTAAPTSSYNAATLSVDVAVTRSTVTLTWATPAAVTYGTLLSATQLNATASVPGTFAYQPAIGTRLNAGFQRLTTTFTPNSPQYLPTSASVILEVRKVPTTITWNAPAAITYGTPLTTTQLNASATSPGTFYYSPTLNTKLSAGTHTLNGLFVPSDTTNYEDGSKSVSITVAQASQSIAWNPVSTFSYGTPLGSDHLNASVSVIGPSAAGALTYSHAPGTILPVGTHTLTANAAGTPDYTTATRSLSFTVLKAVPAITWPSPGNIAYGTPLSAAQLNATASVPGTITYQPAAGTVLPAGTTALLLTFTPQDTANYETTTASVTLTVEPATPTITWPQPAGIAYGTALNETQLNATANTDGTFNYDPAAGTVLPAGTHTLAVNFVPSSSNYTPASGTTTIVVAKRNPVITWSNPAPITYGTPLSSTQLNATSNGNGGILYDPPAGTVLPAGTHVLTATIATSPNEGSATATVTITVVPAPLTLGVNDAGVQYSDPLPSFSVSGVGFQGADTLASLSGVLAFTTNATSTSAPGTYGVEAAGLTSGNYAITYQPGVLTITREDAAVLITTPSFAATGTVHLAATVTDSSHFGIDTHPGDLTLASVTFVNRSTGATLCSAPIGMISPTSGTAVCTITSAAGLTIGARLTGHYTRDNADDDKALAISAPGTDTLDVTGTLAVTKSAGTHAPALSDASIQLSLTSASAQGTMSYDRVDNGITRRYRVTLLPGPSFAVQRAEEGGRSVIHANGRLEDVTDANAPTLVVNSAPLMLTLTDGGTAAFDTLAVTLHHESGGLWMAAGWNGITITEDALTAGSIVFGTEE